MVTWTGNDIVVSLPLLAANIWSYPVIWTFLSLVQLCPSELELMCVFALATLKRHLPYWYGQDIRSLTRIPCKQWCLHYAKKKGILKEPPQFEQWFHDFADLDYGLNSVLIQIVLSFCFYVWTMTRGLIWDRNHVHPAHPHVHPHKTPPQTSVSGTQSSTTVPQT